MWVAMLFISLGSSTGLRAQSIYATPYTITTLAGLALSSGSTDGVGAAARFSDPDGVAVDGLGNVYVSDCNNHTVRKITPAGVVTTLAGLAGNSGSANGAGSAARFNYPQGLAVDGAGNVYVADTGNHAIRLITPAGLVTTFAGMSGTFGLADGTANTARFRNPRGVAVDVLGNVYVTDTGNHTIRMITAAGVVSTFAGTPGISGFGDGTGNAVEFRSPYGVAVDRLGNVYVADTGNQLIRKITSVGLVTTLAGTLGGSSVIDRPGNEAWFDDPKSLAVDWSGNVFVADFTGQTLRKITPVGIVTTIAGSGLVRGSSDGTGSDAQFFYPNGMAMDSAGNIYVADSLQNTIRKGALAADEAPTFTVQPASQTLYVGAYVTLTVAARGIAAPTLQWQKDGVNLAGQTNATLMLVRVQPTENATYSAVATNQVGSTPSNGAVLTVLLNYPNPYAFSTFAGTAFIPGSSDGMGLGASFARPAGVAVDGAGNIYVADTPNNTIRKITADGVVTTFAGSAGVPGSSDGMGSSARFNHPIGVAVDGAGNVYVADNANYAIRKITPAGLVTTFAGGTDGFNDGTGSAAQFFDPGAVAVDGSGTVYVGESSANKIRKITFDGVVTTFAGGLASGSIDGTGSNAMFHGPAGVAVDGVGNVYVADTGNHTIRRITSSGVVTTLAGTAGSSGSADGTGSAARFNYPAGMAVDGAGNLYVVDYGNHTIRRITSDGQVTTIAGLVGSFTSTDGTGSDAWFQGLGGVAVDAAEILYVADVNAFTIRKGLPHPRRGDFDGDGRADVLLNGGITGERAVWLMNGTGIKAGAFIGVSSTNLSFSGIGDFDGDGKSDILLTNSISGERLACLMNGASIKSSASLGVLHPDWVIGATGDFDGDGQSDILMTNTVTGERGIWIIYRGSVRSSVSVGTLPAEWSFSGTGDFNGDGRVDILLSNTTTGDRAIWLMNGAAISSGVYLGALPTEWSFSGIGDFNGDGRADILLSNTVTGDRAIWLMNGTAISAGAYLGMLPASWVFSQVGDFNADGKADLFLTNTVTGERAIWLMNGTTIGAGASLGIVSTDWLIMR